MPEGFDVEGEVNDVIEAGLEFLLSFLGLKDYAEKLMNGLKTIMKFIEPFSDLISPLGVVEIIGNSIGNSVGGLDEVFNLLTNTPEYASGWLKTIVDLFVGNGGVLNKLGFTSPVEDLKNLIGSSVLVILINLFTSLANCFGIEKKGSIVVTAIELYKEFLNEDGRFNTRNLGLKEGAKSLEILMFGVGIALIIYSIYEYYFKLQNDDSRGKDFRGENGKNQWGKKVLCLFGTIMESVGVVMTIYTARNGLVIDLPAIGKCYGFVLLFFISLIGLAMKYFVSGLTDVVISGYEIALDVSCACVAIVSFGAGVALNGGIMPK